MKTASSERFAIDAGGRFAIIVAMNRLFSSSSNRRGFGFGMLATTVFAGGLVAVVGCSSSNLDDLFGSVGGNGGASASTSAGKGATTASGPGATGSTSTGAKASTGVGPGSSSSGGPGPTVSSSGSGIPVTVSCNNMVCPAGDVCCFNPNGPGDHCGQSGQCGPGFVQLSCNGPNDCPNENCCATLEQGSKLEGIACQATCGQPSEIIVCSQNGPNVCQGNTQCQAVPALGSGYNLCIGG